MIESSAFLLRDLLFDLKAELAKSRTDGSTYDSEYQSGLARALYILEEKLMYFEISESDLELFVREAIDNSQ